MGGSGKAPGKQYISIRYSVPDEIYCVHPYFSEYNDLHFSKWLSSSPTSGERRGGMVALSQMPTFLAIEQKKIYGDIVTPSIVTCENLGTLVTSRDEKTM